MLFGTAAALAVLVSQAYPAGDHHVPAAVERVAKNQAVYVCKLGKAPQLAHGSGCLVSASGLVLTNWHVVIPTLAQGTRRVKVDWVPWWPGGAAGAVVYAAPELDLALIKLDKAPGGQAARMGDTARQGARIYPVGFTSRAEAPRGSRGLWQETLPGLGLTRTIDTGEIVEAVQYSFSETVKKPPHGVSQEDWTRLREQAEKMLDDAHRRPRQEGESDTWVAYLSNAWTTGGQSGGPSFGEDGQMIALNHAGGIWEKGNYQGSAEIPVDLIRLFLVGVQDTGQVHDGIVRKFQRLGGRDVVGLPLEPDGEALARTSGNGMLQVFRSQDGHESGIMLRSGSPNAFWVTGAIWAHYASKGGPQYIGYPIADEEEAEGGRRQRFERGTLYWSRAAGQVSKLNASGEPVRLRSKNGDVTALVAGGVTDFTLTFEVNVAEREGSAFFRLSSDSAEVYGRPTHGLSGYGVIFCPFSDQGANPGLYLVKRVNGVEQTLASTQTGFPRTDGKSRLTISARGGELAVYEEGSRVLRAEDTSYGTGDIVFRIYGDPELPADAQFRATEFQRLR